jgi:hypothetical protein
MTVQTWDLPAMLQIDGTSSQTQPRDSERTRRAWLFYATALLPALLLFVLHWGNLPRIESTDFAQYMMQAESFLRGEGIMASRYLFTDQNLIYGPKAYPPGLPLMLVPIIGVFGPSLLATKVLMLAFAIAFLLLAGHYFGSRYGVWAGVAVTLITGVALEASYATQAPQSDLGFCAFVWALIVLADTRKEWSWGRVLVITLLGLAALSFRTAGVVLVPALGLYALTRWRDLGIRGFVPVFLWGAAVLGAMSLVGSSIESAGMNALPQFARYRLAVFHAELYPFRVNVANDAYHAIGSLLVLVGLAAWLIQTRLRSFLVIFIALYVVMIGFVKGSDDRYLWPAFPVLAFGLAYGARVVVKWLRGAWSEERLQRVALAVVVVVSLVATVTAALRPRPVSLLALPDVQALFERVRQYDSDRSTRVVFVNARVMAWQTGVHTMPLFPGSSEQILTELRRHRITHVVAGDLGILSPSNEQLEAAVRAMPERFVPEYRNRTFVLYRFVDRARGAAPDEAEQR